VHPTLFILAGDYEPFDLLVPCFSTVRRDFFNSDSLGMSVDVH